MTIYGEIHASLVAFSSNTSGRRRTESTPRSARAALTQIQRDHCRKMSAIAGSVAWDRTVSATETRRRLLPLLGRYGVTRVAKQTGLDRIGLPCFAAIRPNAHNLATSQGKGLTEDAAWVSAVMEAVEYAVAEVPEVPSFRCSIAELGRDGMAWYDPAGFLPEGQQLGHRQQIRWILGFAAVSQVPVAVPYDLVSLSGRAPDLPGICQTSNGLAAGNTESEAIFHALCELIERDANTRWLAATSNWRQSSRLNSLAHPDLTFGLRDLITASGMELHLFDQTSDLAVPVIMAVIADRGGAGRKFQMAAGYGAHPLVSNAMLKAIAEAAQTRITSIASARDDIAAAEFSELISEDLYELLLHPETIRKAPKDAFASGHPAEMAARLSETLKLKTCAEPVVVRLTGVRSEVSVVRVLHPTLEDAEANLNWRPGVRAEAMLSA